MHRIEKITFLKRFSVLEKHGENVAEVIVVNGRKWLNENYIKLGLDHANLTVITKRYPSEYRKHRYELVDEPRRNERKYFHTKIWQ